MYYSDQTCKRIGSTKMACPDMSLENQLNEVLLRADNYSILGNDLSLNRQEWFGLRDLTSMIKTIKCRRF